MLNSKLDEKQNPKDVYVYLMISSNEYVLFKRKKRVQSQDSLFYIYP